MGLFDRKTGAEKIAAKRKRFEKSGNIAKQYQADLLGKAMQDPMEAKMTAQERGGMALEAGAAAGAAAANTGLGEAMLAGADPAQVAAMNQQIQQGVTQAGYGGAKAAEEADQRRVFDAQQAKEQAMQDAIAEKVRQKQQTFSDIQNTIATVQQAKDFVKPPADETLEALRKLGLSSMGGT